MTKRIWVFGAGASAADTEGKAPLDVNFFEKIHESFKKDIDEEYFIPLEKVLDEIYNYDLWKRRGSTPGLEEVFTFLETSLHWLEMIQGEQGKKEITPTDLVDNFYAPILAMHGDQYKYLGANFSTDLRHKLDTADKLLIYAMVRIFYRVSQLKRFSYHDNILKKIKEGDIIITTNYDLILDKCLMKYKLFNPVNGYFQIFWNEFEKIHNNIEGYKVSYWEKDKSKVVLLKLHGSINWKYKQKLIPSDGNHFIRLEDSEVNNYNDFSGAQEIAITPLVINKQDHFSPVSKFGRVWAKAFEELSKAGEIVFLGYSFPPTDFLCVQLFKLAEIKRRRSSTKGLKIFFSTKDKKASIDKNESSKLRNYLSNIYMDVEPIDLGDFSEAADYDFDGVRHC